MKNFYVYLPSNTNFLPENNASRYVTKLAKELNLGSEWECCLKEIHYPRSWNTLAGDEGKYYVHHLNPNSWEAKRVPIGHYDDASQFISALNKTLKSIKVTADLVTHTNIVVFTIPPGIELVFSEPLSSLLGLATNETEYCRGPRKTSRYPMNLDRGIDSIYVYSDVIQTKLARPEQFLWSSF